VSNTSTARLKREENFVLVKVRVVRRVFPETLICILDGAVISHTKKFLHKYS